jgi:PPOX class probable F420-dependent enzyme
MTASRKAGTRLATSRKASSNLQWDPKQRRFVATARVARLATADAAARPHVVPVCFVLSGDSIYSAIDLKPKRRAAENLRRLRNIIENPEVTVLVDRYSEDWKQLAFVLLRGHASLAPAGEAQRAVRWLRRKYPQYRTMPLEGRPVIKVRLTSAYSWGAF